jgi:hypothetical protein
MNNPSITPDIIEWLPCADGPVAILIGNKPKTKASEVMMIGRLLSLAASIGDSISPCTDHSINSEINYVIRYAK